MSCRALEPSLLLRAHGQLGGMRRLWLDTHLRTCPACREKWAHWVLERDAMRRALAPPAEVDTSAERLMTAVAIRIRTEPREAPPAAAAAFAASRKPVRLLALAVLILLLAGATAAIAGLGPMIADFLPATWLQGQSGTCAPLPHGPPPPGVVPPALRPQTSPALPPAAPAKPARKAAAITCDKQL